MEFVRNKITTDTIEVVEKITSEATIRSSIREQGSHFYTLYVSRIRDNRYSSFHVRPAKDIEVFELAGDGGQLSAGPTLVLKLRSNTESEVIVYLHNITMDDLANAIGCEQMAQQATMEGQKL